MPKPGRWACTTHASPIPTASRQINIPLPLTAFTRANGRTLLLRNTNKLLTQNPWVTGMKTGYTNAAGRCLVSSAGVNGRHVIVVVLGCHPSRIWTESENLIRWALGYAV